MQKGSFCRKRAPGILFAELGVKLNPGKLLLLLPSFGGKINTSFFQNLSNSGGKKFFFTLFCALFWKNPYGWRILNVETASAAAGSDPGGKSGLRRAGSPLQADTAEQICGKDSATESIPPEFIPVRVKWPGKSRPGIKATYSVMASPSRSKVK